MTMLPKIIKRGKIDTSGLPFAAKKRKPDSDYLKSYNGTRCLVCKSSESTVGCHIRTNSRAGIGTKPDDALTLPLCHIHHSEQHDIGERAFFKKYFGWSITQAKKAAKDRYKTWSKSNG